MTTSTPGGRPPAASATARRLYALYRGREDYHAEAYQQNGAVAYRPVHAPLTVELLTEHVSGTRVVGAYVLRGDSTTTFGVIDLDSSARIREKLPDDQLPSLGVARRLRLEAIKLGVPERAMLISFSGSKGHHLTFFFAEPVEAHQVRQLLRLVLSKVELASSLTAEVFPKQDRLDDAERGPDEPLPLGSLVKLPLARHPKTGKTAVLVDPGRVTPMPAATVAAVLLGNDVPPDESEPAWPHDVGDAPIFEGDGRHAYLTSVAGTLRERGHHPDEILDVLLVLNQKRCRPPKDEREVRRIADWFAHKRPGGEVVTGAAPEAEWEQVPSPTSFAAGGLPDEACLGLAWRLTHLVGEYVESDEAALLAEFLTAFGIAAGSASSFYVGATRHTTRLYLGLIGTTSRARKGSGWDALELLFRKADPAFVGRIRSGLGSGEQLVHLCADPESGGGGDGRLLVLETELARLLVAMSRDGSTLSEYLRDAYDGRVLRNDVKRDGAVSSAHHIGLIGHSTPDELRGRLSETDLRNGLANRVLWIQTRRAHVYPEPKVFEGQVLTEAATELREALERARAIRRVERTRDATEVWRSWYQALADDDHGPLAAVTNRAEAQVVRLSLTYALAEGSDVVDVEHLRAATALWDFSVRSANDLFGQSTGDLIADRILDELAYGPLQRVEAWNKVFNRHVSAQALERAVRLLESRGLLVRERVATPGRPTERWRKP